MGHDVDGEPWPGLLEIDGHPVTKPSDRFAMPLRSVTPGSSDGKRIAFDTCANTIAASTSHDLAVVAPQSDRLSAPRRSTHGIDIPLRYTSPALGWHSSSPTGDALVYETGRGGSRRIDIIISPRGVRVSWSRRPDVEAEFWHG